MNSTHAPAARPAVADILDALAMVIGTVPPPDARWEAELGLDSIELTALGAVLGERFGVDLAACLAGLGLEELIELTADRLAAALAGGIPGSRVVVAGAATG